MSDIFFNIRLCGIQRAILKVDSITNDVSAITEKLLKRGLHTVLAIKEFDKKTLEDIKQNKYQTILVYQNGHIDEMPAEQINNLKK